jgi:hypothetical protein
MREEKRCEMGIDGLEWKESGTLMPEGIMKAVERGLRAAKTKIGIGAESTWRGSSSRLNVMQRKADTRECITDSL